MDHSGEHHKLWDSDPRFDLDSRKTDGVFSPKGENRALLGTEGGCPCCRAVVDLHDPPAWLYFTAAVAMVVLFLILYSSLYSCRRSEQSCRMRRGGVSRSTT